MQTTNMVCPCKIMNFYPSAFLVSVTSSLHERFTWPKSLYGFFHKIKDTFSIFTSNFIDLDILSISALSRVVEHWLFSINVSIWSLSTSTGLPDRGASHVQSVIAPFPIHCTNVFLRFSCIFSFFEVIKHNVQKMLCIFFHIQY